MDKTEKPTDFSQDLKEFLDNADAPLDWKAIHKDENWKQALLKFHPDRIGRGIAWRRAAYRQKYDRLKQCANTFRSKSVRKLSEAKNSFVSTSREIFDLNQDNISNCQNQYKSHSVMRKFLSSNQTGPQKPYSSLGKILDLVGSDPLKLPKPSQLRELNSFLNDHDLRSEAINLKSVYSEKDFRIFHFAEVISCFGQHIEKKPSSSSGAIVVDIRCLQDPSLAKRGVGRLARIVLDTLIATIDSETSKSFFLLVDPDLPPPNDLPDFEFRPLRSIYEIPGLKNRVDLYVQLSPMTAQPIVEIPFLLNAKSSVSVIYDLIPGKFPDVYLSDLEAFLLYKANICALGLFDNYLSISEATLNEHATLLQKDPKSFYFIGGPVNSALAPTPNRHSEKDQYPFYELEYVVAPTGGDYRKNFLAAMYAHVEAFKNQEEYPPLVFLGNLSPIQISELKYTANVLDFPDQHLFFVSDLTDKELGEVLAGAKVAIVPSLSEGLSLPLLECTTCGTPVVYSSIECHKELLGDGRWNAPPDDILGLAQALQFVWDNPDDVLKQQNANQKFRFDEDSVALRISEALRTIVSQIDFRPELPQSAPRVAFCSPWPPASSGVADYGYSTVDSLKSSVDVTVLTNTENPQAIQNVEIKPLSVKNLLLEDFEIPIFVLGNSYFHRPILELLKQFPAPVISHDVRMLEYYLYHHSIDYAVGFLHKYGKSATPEVISESLDDLNRLPDLFYDEIASHATPLLVHSHVLSSRIRLETGTSSRVLPYPPHNRPPESSSRTSSINYYRFRKELDIPSEEISILLSGGVDIRTKCGDAIIEAFKWLVDWGYNVSLYFVGPPNDQVVDQLKSRIGHRLRAKVHFTGAVPQTTLFKYYQACNLGVQVRSSSLLSLSGSVLDMAAFGLPFVVNESMAKELPELPYKFVVPDSFGPLVLAKKIAESIDSNIPPEELERDRLDFLNNHNFEKYSQSLLSVIMATDKGLRQ